MNSFFASVEQQVRPDFRGKPLGVTPYIGTTGCLIAVSRDAKKIGIKTGSLVGEARKNYPMIEVVESRPALYMIYHQEIRKVLESFSPHFIPLSIDEFILELSPSEQNYQSCLNLARAIKKQILKKVGDYLTCSVGVGPNKFLAKMAGESQKPDGLVILRLNQLKDFYTNLKLRDLTGINFRMEKQLKEAGIFSPTDLYSLSLMELQKKFKHWGRMWYFRMRGYEVDDYQSETQNIGHSYILPPESRTREGVESVIEKLITKVGYRLRKAGYFASGVSVSIGFTDAVSFAKVKRTASFNDNATLHKEIFNILVDCEWGSRPIHVAVSAHHLSSNRFIQIDIFKENEKSKKISQTMDLLSDEFGPEVIFPASMHEALKSAPDRIPFGKPRYDIRNI